VVTDGARMGLLSPAGRAERLGRRLLAGLDLPPAAEEVRALEAVGPAQVRDAARDAWRPSRIVVATVGDPPAGVARRLPALVTGGR
jgi:predicted Zn-dependent peptidase